MKETVLKFINDSFNSLCITGFNSKEKIKESIQSFYEKHKENLISYGLFLLITIAIFGYILSITHFKVALSGDGYIQEQNFPYKYYDDWHEFFRTGHFPNWDTSVGIGSNNIGGNTFYSLLSPFMMLMLPFPRSWIQVELGIRYLLETSLACFFFFLYLKEFKLSIWTRRAGGLAYGFCGSVLYYMWFEHFLDSFVLFPLILWGIERIIKERDPRLLLISLFLQGMTNYFYLVVFCFGGVFYAVWRYFSLWNLMRKGRIRFEVVLLGFFAFAFGILSSMIVLLPGIMNAQAMPRVTSASYLEELTDIWKYGSFKELLKKIGLFDEPFQNLYAISGLIFTPTHSYSNSLVGPNFYDNLSGSAFVYTPILLFAFTGGFYAIRKCKANYLLGALLCCLILFCPFFYYLFSGFTVGYARFLIVPSSWIIAFACVQIDEKEKLTRVDLTFAYALLTGLQILTAVLARKTILDNPTVYQEVYRVWDRFLVVPLEMGYALLCYIVLMTFFKKEKLSGVTFALVAIEAIACGNVLLYFHGYGDDNNIEVASRGEDILSRETNIIDSLENYDNGMYRVQNPTVLRWNNNTHMKVGHNGISAFNSNYAFDSQDFLDWSYIPYSYHNWSMGEHNRRVNVETFLGVKYYMVAKRDLNVPFGFENVMDIKADSLTDPNEKKALLNLQATIKKNYENDTQDHTVSRELYVNKNYVNFAFPFDTIQSSSIYSSSYYADYNEFGYLRTGIVDSNVFDDVKYLANKNGVKVNEEVTSAYFAYSYSNIDVSIEEVSEDKALLHLTLNATLETYDIPVDKKVVDGNTIYTSSDYGITLTKYSNSYLTFEGFGSGIRTSFQANSDGSYRFNSIPLINQEPVSLTLYPTKWENNQIIPTDQGTDLTKMTDTEKKGLNQSTKLVIESTKDSKLLFQGASEKDPFYFSIRSSDEWKWHFYDENDQEIYLAGDTSYVSDYQDAHGFYTTKPLKRIEGYLAWTMSADKAISTPSVYSQHYTMYKLATDKLNKEPIQMLSSSSDRYHFITDYSKPKYVVLNNPILDGWTLMRKTENGLENVNIYKSQGGFIGFFDNGGEHEYILTYVAPGLALGQKAALIGLAGMFFMNSIYLVCHYYDDKKLKHNLYIQEELNARRYR